MKIESGIWQISRTSCKIRIYKNGVEIDRTFNRFKTEWGEYYYGNGITINEHMRLMRMYEQYFKRISNS